jgi:hypothetical protein
MVDCLNFIPIAVEVLLAELLVSPLPVFKKSICIGVYENVYFNVYANKNSKFPGLFAGAEITYVSCRSSTAKRD